MSISQLESLSAQIGIISDMIRNQNEQLKTYREMLSTVEALIKTEEELTDAKVKAVLHKAETIYDYYKDIYKAIEIIHQQLGPVLHKAVAKPIAGPEGITMVEVPTSQYNIQEQLLDLRKDVNALADRLNQLIPGKQ